MTILTLLFWRPKSHMFRSCSALSAPSLTPQRDRRGRSWTELISALTVPAGERVRWFRWKNSAVTRAVLHNPGWPSIHMRWHVSRYYTHPVGWRREHLLGWFDTLWIHTRDAQKGGRCCWRSTGYACPSQWRRWVFHSFFLNLFDCLRFTVVQITLLCLLSETDEVSWSASLTLMFCLSLPLSLQSLANTPLWSLLNHSAKHKLMCSLITTFCLIKCA